MPMLFDIFVENKCGKKHLFSTIFLTSNSYLIKKDLRIWSFNVTEIFEYLSSTKNKKMTDNLKLLTYN